MNAVSNSCLVSYCGLLALCFIRPILLLCFVFVLFICSAATDFFAHLFGTYTAPHRSPVSSTDHNGVIDVNEWLVYASIVSSASPQVRMRFQFSVFDRNHDVRALIHRLLASLFCFLSLKLIVSGLHYLFGVSGHYPPPAQDGLHPAHSTQPKHTPMEPGAPHTRGTHLYRLISL